MRVDQFDFDLPETSIALRPAQPRDSAKLLVVKPDEEFHDSCVSCLADFLTPNDLVIFNDTKVIPAQLHGVRVRGEARAQISATLHMRISSNRWLAFVKGAKRLKIGDCISFGPQNDTCMGDQLSAKVMARNEAEVELAFDLDGPALDEALHRVGHIPLPPYIASKRADDEADRKDYQTIYAREEGAVAAPTAGLHFTPALLNSLKSKNIDTAFVTLHVGAGTFLPVKVDDTADHKMHSEIGHLSEDIAARICAVKANGGRVVAVGTTALRVLETAAKKAQENGSAAIQAWSGATDIFITPGYQFACVDVLMTNFHLPRSTLFMLVSAFCGFDTMHAAYSHAIDNEYRFYSYGDSSLLFKSEQS